MGRGKPGRPYFSTMSHNSTNKTLLDTPNILKWPIDHPRNILVRQYRSVARDTTLENEALTLLTPNDVSRRPQVTRDVGEDHPSMTAVY